MNFDYEGAGNFIENCLFVQPFFRAAHDELITRSQCLSPAQLAKVRLVSVYAQIHHMVAFISVGGGCICQGTDQRTRSRHIQPLQCWCNVCIFFQECTFFGKRTLQIMNERVYVVS